MHRLAAIAVGLVSVAGFAGAASAGDLPVKVYTKAPPVAAPIYNWGGFYVGVDGGGASSRNCWNVTNSLGTPVPTMPSQVCHDATGGLVGGQIGYRWQMTNWVFGLEAQGDWANLKGSNTSLIGTFAGLPFADQTKISAIGLFTGQIGYAWNNVLWYVKGGAAVTRDKYNGVSNSPPAPSRPASPLIRPLKPAGVVRSEPASNSALRRIGRLRSNTTIFSWTAAAQTSSLPLEPSTAPTASSRTSIWAPFA
jgi:hypothetical protein